MISIDQLKHCVSVDIETTGTDENLHGIVSIGARTFVSDESFYKELIMPEGIQYDPKALEVNGETEQSLKARSEPEYTKCIHGLIELLDWCNKQDVGVIIGKNPDFDHRFMQHWWTKSGLSLDSFNDVLTFRSIDWADFVVPLYLWHGYTIPKSGLKNIDLNRFLKIPDEPRPHIASVGAQFNVNCVKRILEMYQENSE